MDPVAIRFDKVSRRFQGERRGEVWALREASLECSAGAVTVIVGPSGCGKTTLLRLAAGLDRPTSGEVRVGGAAVTAPPAGVGLVSQEGDLLPWRRVLANIELGLELRRVPRPQRRRRAWAALRRAGLDETVARCYPHELSGGMRQRVALARALCPNPGILLMDEPFASLDEPARHQLQQDLLDLRAADNQSVLLVTHSIEEAVFLADHLVIMSAGRIGQRIRLELDRPRDRLSGPFVQALLQVRTALGACYQA